jgi:hypothetical protein
MDEKFIFGSFISLWDMDENERAKIGIGTSLEEIFKYMTKFMTRIPVINNNND